MKLFATRIPPADNSGGGSIPSTRHTVWVFAAVLLLATVVWGLRYPDRLTAPQIRDEDGYIFFQEDAMLGWAAFLKPYNGYLYTLQRGVAAVSGFFHPRWTPWIFNWTTLLLTAAVVARISVSRIPRRWRIGFGAVFLVHPFCHWQAVHLTNLAWFVSALFPVFALERAPSSRWGRGATLAITGILGLTGPFAIVFAPVFALRVALLDRSRYAIALLGIVLLTAGAQGVALAGGSRAGMVREWTVPAPVEMWNSVNRFLVHTFFGRFADEESPAQSFAAIAVLIAFAAGVGTGLGRQESREDRVRLLLLALGIPLVYAASVLGSPVPWLEVLPGINQSRYYILPYLLFGWTLAALGCIPRSPGRWLWLRVPALALFFGAAFTKFSASPLPPSTWASDLAAMETKPFGMLRLNPPGRDSHVFMAKGNGRHGFARGAELRELLDPRALMKRLFGLEIESYLALESFIFMFPESVGKDTALLIYPRTTFTLRIPPNATAFKGKYGYSALAVPEGDPDRMAGGDGFLVEIALGRLGELKQPPLSHGEFFKPMEVGIPRQMRPFRIPFAPGEWNLVVIQLSGGRKGERDIAFDFSIWADLAFEFEAIP